MNKKAPVSGYVIAYQEAHQIERCLEGLFNFCDEVVVADMSSPDGTAEVARKAGARVITIPRHPCEAPVRAEVLAALKHDWVYTADADEKVPAAMGDRIREIMSGNPEPANYLVPLKHIIFGRRLRHSGMTNDRGFLTISRFYHREAVRVKEQIHHEYEFVKPVLKVWKNEAEMETLAHEHYWSLSINHFLWKLARYTDSEHLANLKNGHQTIPARKLITSPVKEFFTRYVIQQGYKDGSLGLEMCGMMATYQFYRILKTRNPQHIGRIEGF